MQEGAQRNNGRSQKKHPVSPQKKAQKEQAGTQTMDCEERTPNLCPF